MEQVRFIRQERQLIGYGVGGAMDEALGTLRINATRRSMDNCDCKADVTLAPCPFCGGQAMTYITQVYSDYGSIVQCTECEVRTKGFPIRDWTSNESRIEAITAWNTRVKEEK